MRSTLKYFLLFLPLIFISSYIKADHPIFIMLTHPRATGTAFEQVMRTQEDVLVLHAPYFDAYLIRKYGLNHLFTLALPDKTLTFEGVTNKLFTQAKTSPIFFKESGYLLIDYLKEHPEFYKNSQVKLAFLIRDPAKSVLSFYKKMPTVNETIVGHRQLWELFLMFKEQLKETPLVIDSDEFLKDPLYVLNQLGAKWGYKFQEENLKWESGYAEDWHLKDWYVEVANSTNLWAYEGDVLREEDGTPKYLEVADEKDRQRLQELYKTQNVYYQNLLQYAIKGTK